MNRCRERVHRNNDLEKVLKIYRVFWWHLRGDSCLNRYRQMSLCARGQRKSAQPLRHTLTTPVVRSLFTIIVQMIVFLARQCVSVRCYSSVNYTTNALRPVTREWIITESQIRIYQSHLARALANVGQSRTFVNSLCTDYGRGYASA